MNRRRYVFVTCIAVIIVGLICFYAFTTPSHNRNWATDQAVLPFGEFNEDKSEVLIRNIRNFKYESTTLYEPAYYDKRFSINDLSNVYFVVEPFSGTKGAAHTFLSFEFAKNGDVNDRDFVAISIEIRKEVGESFSALKGLLDRYELMYVIADERDVVKLRSNYRKDDVYVYPIKTTPERAQSLFVSMIDRANGIYNQPEFYNSVFNNCTTNIARHVNSLLPGRVPFNLTLILPKESDRYAFDLDLIDTDLPRNTPMSEVRNYFHINKRAEAFADSPDFSERIRDFGNETGE